jgi:hypothetical protein
VTREHGINTVFWRFELAPVRWTEAPLAGRVRWSVAAGGVESATLTVAGSGEAWRIRVVLVRLDPAALDFSLDTASTTTGWPAGAIGRAPKSAVFAMNAGQFRSTAPWGMVVINGRRTLPAERGPLAVTIAVDSSGLVHWIPDGAPLPDAVRWAFQSYPAVLRARQVPMASQVPDRGVDVGHRDARRAIASPSASPRRRWRAVMGALGAEGAVLLDGGISAQLVAGTGPARLALRGWRDVPLALIARSKAAAPISRRRGPGRSAAEKRDPLPTKWTS